MFVNKNQDNDSAVLCSVSVDEGGFLIADLDRHSQPATETVCADYLSRSAGAIMPLADLQTVDYVGYLGNAITATILDLNTKNYYSER